MMKNRPFLYWKNHLIVWCIALLGFSACDPEEGVDDDPEEEIRPMYGTASALFIPKKETIEEQTKTIETFQNTTETEN